MRGKNGKFYHDRKYKKTLAVHSKQQGEMRENTENREVEERKQKKKKTKKIR